MRVLITGTGTSGSWKIRGEQLGEAIGADVVPCAGPKHCQRADLIVIVKRVRPQTEAAIRASGRRVVWDVVDGWPQRQGRPMSEPDAKAWLKAALHRMRPHAVVWPTTQMQRDGKWHGPGLVLPHHAWPKYSLHPVSDAVRIVGYEGGAHYLGKWRNLVQVECDLRGWQFQINGDMQQADIGIALRDNSGYPEQNWKSNCKLANLQALGIPALCSPECGYLDTARNSVLWVSSAGDINFAFDRLEDRSEREHFAALNVAPRLDDVATTYREWLHGL